MAVPPEVSLRIEKDVRASRAVTLLSVYVALLWGIPSAQTIGVLGSLGTPSLLWGFVCLAYWAWARAGGAGSLRPLQPVRIALVLFLVFVWLSFSLAQARGLPPDEISPSTTALIRTVSWSGVLLLANDGLTTKEQFFSLARRISLFGGMMALLGLAQFTTGEQFIDRIQLPGFTVNEDLLGVVERSGFARANATATHPLEYAVILVAVMPLSLALAVAGPRRRCLRAGWIPVATGLACLLSVSRSAIVGFVVGLTVMMVALSPRIRLLILCVLGAGLVLVYVAVPGMIGSIAGLFLGQDASKLSRTNGLAVAADVVAQHPILGRGFGTFLPKYYILDNELALFMTEVGLLGVLALVLLVIAALVQSQRGRRAAPDQEIALLAHSLTAAVAASFSLFAFFDAFSFGMAAGTLMLMVGMSGGIFNAVSTQGQASARPILSHSSRGLAGNASDLLATGKRALLFPAVVIALGALLLAGFWSTAIKPPPIYWTRSDVFLAPAKTSADGALIVPPDEDLSEFGLVVERVVNDGHPVRRLMSSAATLYGLGVSDGVSIQMRNDGNQWVPLFPDPVIVVETVASSREVALARNQEAQAAIADAVTQLQEGQGVLPSNYVHPVAITRDPTVAEVTSSRRGRLMALVASGAAIALLTAGGAALAYLAALRIQSREKGVTMISPTG